MSYSDLNLPDRSHTLKPRNYRHNVFGLDILCCNSDIEFIKQRMRLIAPPKRHDIAREYSRLFYANYQAEKNKAGKEGAGRFAANSYLRTLIRAIY